MQSGSDTEPVSQAETESEVYTDSDEYTDSDSLEWIAAEPELVPGPVEDPVPAPVPAPAPGSKKRRYAEKIVVVYKSSLRIKTTATCDGCEFEMYSRDVCMAVDQAAQLKQQDFGICGECRHPPAVRVQVTVRCLHCPLPHNVIAVYECVYATAQPVIGSVPVAVECPRCE